MQQFHRIPSGRNNFQLGTPSGGTTGPKESGPRAHGNNRQFLSVAPNAILTPRAQTASQTFRRAGRTRRPFSRLDGGGQRRGLLTRKSEGEWVGESARRSRVLLCGF